MIKCNMKVLHTVYPIIPLLSVTIRRLHDIDISGWGALWWFFPIWGGILVFTWFCKDSDIEKNEYGESPKYIMKLDDNS
ncbi:MAG: DUF805 domain-containing protein [Bacteroidaceae bacterium]|nr:DUF805 domain-containing protein [Bacteroidaceae bacterium]